MTAKESLTARLEIRSYCIEGEPLGPILTLREGKESSDSWSEAMELEFAQLS